LRNQCRARHRNLNEERIRKTYFQS
jgi:hypothetical protein